MSRTAEVLSGTASDSTFTPSPVVVTRTCHLLRVTGAMPVTFRITESSKMAAIALACVGYTLSIFAAFC